jgi:UDP-N-acetylglucosamine--dolichyl-phosphate N-acetylglucosaminephosphotransferase
VSHILAAALTITTITMIAMIDDLTGLMKRQVLKRVGLKQKHKFLLPLPAAIPLMAVNAGVSTISLPFFGTIDAGVLYSLLLVPLGIFGAANATNMLAGLNGLEASMGFVALFSLGLFSLINNQIDAAVLAFSFAGALIGFLYFNRYPARIMPGDSLTYAIGATIASVAVVGNIERFALVIFLPWFVEFSLKARTKFKGESFGKLQKDGSLMPINNRIESLTHIPMVLFKANEKKVVLSLVLAEALICLIAFLIYA